MPITIHPITTSDIASAIQCIQLSFANDPYAVWAFDKACFNRDRNFYSLKAKCEWGIRNALFYVAKDTVAADPDEVVGVSMWVKPRNVSERQTWVEWVDDYVLWLKQGVNLLWYRGRGGLRTDRYWIWKMEQAKAQKGDMDGGERILFL